MEMTIAILGSSVLATIISCVFQYINKKTDKRMELLAKTSDFEKGLSLLLLSSLKRDGREIIAQGAVSKSDYDSFMATYNAYKALGGDGWADAIKTKVELLERDIDD